MINPLDRSPTWVLPAEHNAVFSRQIWFFREETLSKE